MKIWNRLKVKTEEEEGDNGRKKGKGLDKEHV